MSKKTTYIITGCVIPGCKGQARCPDYCYLQALCPRHLKIFQKMRKVNALRYPGRKLKLADFIRIMTKKATQSKPTTEHWAWARSTAPSATSPKTRTIKQPEGPKPWMREVKPGFLVSRDKRVTVALCNLDGSPDFKLWRVFDSGEPLGAMPYSEAMKLAESLKDRDIQAVA